MGVSVREKVAGSGEWWIFINHCGKRKSKKVGRDRKIAIEVAKKIEAKLILGDMQIDDKNKKSAPLFMAYASLWLNDYIKAIRRQSTFERYSEILKRHVYPTLGNRAIDEISRGEIRNLLLKMLNSGLSKSTITLIHACISGPLSYALDEEIIQANPATGLTKRLNLKRDKESVVPMTWDETSLFLETCQKHFRDYFPFFFCALRTGMRLGELLALRWGNVDWNSRFVEVKRSYKRGRTGLTKTGQERNVDMSGKLTACLRTLQTQRQKEALQDGHGDNVIETIFHRKEKPMEQNYIRRIFKRILKKADMRDMKLHNTRHTFASQLLSSGASPVYVKEQLGHTSIQMTVDIYGKWIPSQNRDAVNRLDLHQSAPYSHPTKNKKAQPLEITPSVIGMVPKARLELAQAYAH